MTSNLVLRSVGRVLWFAIAGALCMALVGVVAGSVTGALVIFVENLNRLSTTKSVFRDIPTGAFMGALYAIFTGLWSGSLAFGVAGVFACLSSQPKRVFEASWRLAWRSAVIGVAIGGASGTVNALLFGRSAWLDLAPFVGYFYGVIGGFIIGTFYGAIAGARREIARQKLEQNAALSTVESAA